MTYPMPDDTTGEFGDESEPVTAPGETGAPDDDDLTDDSIDPLEDPAPDSDEADQIEGD